MASPTDPVLRAGVITTRNVCFHSQISEVRELAGRAESGAQALRGTHVLPFTLCDFFFLIYIFFIKV